MCTQGVNRGKAGAGSRDPRVRRRTPRLTCKPSLAYCVSDVTTDATFKALAEPTRRTILDELAERDDQTLFEICSRLAMKHGLASSRQAISQHLDVLEAAGLIRSRREGRYKFHSIEREPLRHLADQWLD
jgi:DNA-binding transcriptional ArsR family regulator